MGVCTKERKGVTAAVLMATPCTNSLGESGGHDSSRSRKSLSPSTCSSHSTLPRFSFVKEEGEAMATQLRKIGSFEPTELTTETFRDTLSQTVDMLARAIQAQSQQIKELRAKVDELERRQTTEKRTGDKEWEAFQVE